MLVTESEAGEDVLVLALTGRLDTPGVESIETAFRQHALDAHRHILVDLSAVEFVGSMGIRMFVSVGKSLARRGFRLVLQGPQPLVQRVFDTVALDELVPVRADRAVALAVLRG